MTGMGTKQMTPYRAERPVQGSAGWPDVGALASGDRGHILVLSPNATQVQRQSPPQHPEDGVQVRNWPDREAGPRPRGSLNQWIEDGALNQCQTIGAGGQAR